LRFSFAPFFLGFCVGEFPPPFFLPKVEGGLGPLFFLDSVVFFFSTFSSGFRGACFLFPSQNSPLKPKRLSKLPPTPFVEGNLLKPFPPRVLWGGGGGFLWWGGDGGC